MGILPLHHLFHDGADSCVHALLRLLPDGGAGAFGLLLHGGPGGRPGLVGPVQCLGLRQLHGLLRLTQQGEKMLANKQFQRPAPFEKEADGIYRFKCSANQASNYFSSFGANAVILEPKRLRDRMRKMYEDAFLRYQQETEEENKKPRTAGQPDARGE